MFSENNLNKFINQQQGDYFVLMIKGSVMWYLLYLKHTTANDNAVNEVFWFDLIFAIRIKKIIVGAISVDKKNLMKTSHCATQFQKKTDICQDVLHLFPYFTHVSKIATCFRVGIHFFIAKFPNRHFCFLCLSY